MLRWSPNRQRSGSRCGGSQVDENRRGYADDFGISGRAATLMGGSGSGRSGGRPTVESSLRLELPLLRRAGYLMAGHSVSGSWSWSRGGECTGTVRIACTVDVEGTSELVVSFSHEGEAVTQRIRLEGVPMRFGGWRWYARCPFNGRRCTTLVMPNGGDQFASVKAWRLPYASQNEDRIGRAHRRIAKAEAKLERLSPYARIPTHQRLCRRIEQANDVLDYGLAAVVGRLMIRGG